MAGSPLSHQLARSVRLHALGWLVVANLVGVWLAVLLLWPEAGRWVAPLSYGRWVPLHLNLHLYGWCSLPLVGALLSACLAPGHSASEGHSKIALGVWSGALALGAFSWLTGQTSGKLFLDWSGWARPLLGAAMTVLWTLLAAHLWWGRSAARTLRWRLGAVSVTGLLTVPAVLYWASGRGVYPAVNPGSGGATGVSLLGSTLGIVLVYGAVPIFLGTRPRSGARTGWFWAALAVSFIIFSLLDHGAVSQNDAGQILGLGLLLLWIPGLFLYARGWCWSPASRPWLLAAGVWWALLVITGWITFLPGVSEAWKFTHALVAHAHLAMAGLVTAVNFVVLNELDSTQPVGQRPVFWLWQGGCVGHILLLMGLGVWEADYAGDLFYGAPWTQAIFVGRLLTGLAMLAASTLALYEIVWQKSARKVLEAPTPVTSDHDTPLLPRASAHA